MIHFLDTHDLLTEMPSAKSNLFAIHKNVFLKSFCRNSYHFFETDLISITILYTFNVFPKGKPSSQSILIFLY